jgi:hypothetical protein
LVPVADCIAATGPMMGMRCDVEGGGDKMYRVWGAVKEGEGSNVAIDRKDFGEKVGGVNKTRNTSKDKVDELLAGPLLEPIETHVN